MKSLIAEIESLVDLAEQMIGIEENERYLAQLDRYVESFSTWQSSLSVSSFDTLPKDAQQELRAALEGLLRIHEAVIARATSEKDNIQQQLLDTRKRIQALRAYLDKLPARITVAGKRQG